jgi:hypothetical protein
VLQLVLTEARLDQAPQATQREPHLQHLAHLVGLTRLYAGRFWQWREHTLKKLLIALADLEHRVAHNEQEARKNLRKLAAGFV